jgi:hypothetical protein
LQASRISMQRQLGSSCGSEPNSILSAPILPGQLGLDARISLTSSYSSSCSLRDDEDLQISSETSRRFSNHPVKCQRAVKHGFAEMASCQLLSHFCHLTIAVACPRLTYVYAFEKSLRPPRSPVPDACGAVGESNLIESRGPLLESCSCCGLVSTCLMIIVLTMYCACASAYVHNKPCSK